MDAVSKENVEELLKEKEKNEKELESLSNTSVNQMWLNDLDTLEKEL